MKPLLLLTTLVLMQTLAVRADSIHDIAVKDIDGKDTTLGAYKGKVLLIVNVASQCGYTPQYQGLETIYEKYKDKGFTVLGFPCNQFGVKFPMFDKIEVNGANRHPLYVSLAGDKSPYPGNIKWNFSKFLIGRDGKIIKRFESKAAPESPEVTAAIEAALGAK
jgi:glutathione peroxidase